ncbi:MAG: alpha-amylase family glycosyl hydrolase [Candidatus Methylacidiphilales bacterium]|nr:alpha-amylase family glycosyl hydrolase [Candidatus Methylacidiphilales bacterium]
MNTNTDEKLSGEQTVSVFSKEALSYIPASKTKRLPSDVEFRGETMYFIVVDRFFDGCDTNTGKEASLNDPTRTNWHKYWGGDLQGIYDKLDYLQGLGVTAIWVTPLFEQLETPTPYGAAPIHGYWTQDFMRINARWVNDNEPVSINPESKSILDRLIEEMHRRGMKLVLDIVCNHSTPESVEGKGKLYKDGVLVADFDNDTEHWYHHYGTITNWQDDWQMQNCELCGLATFNENNILYRRYIKDAVKLWLNKGVDSLRVDTVKHMPIWFWQEFCADIITHKPETFIFGEWIFSHPENPVSTDFANKSGMSILDFGLCVAIRQCFTGSDPGGFHLIEKVLEKDTNYRGANELVTFFENHDMARLQALGVDDAILRLAVALILVSRGIPCLFYGCEQSLVADAEHGEDPYNRPMMAKWDQDTPIYTMTYSLSQERVKNPAIQWGGQWQKYITENVYAFTRRYRESRCFAIFNKGDSIVVDRVETEMPDGEHLCLASGRTVTVTNGGIDKLEMGKSDVLVISHIGSTLTGKSIAHIQLNGISVGENECVAIIGDCDELGNWDLRHAWCMEKINGNTWFGQLVFDQSIGRGITYKYVVLTNMDTTAPRRENRTGRRRVIASEGIAKWRDVWEEF